MGQPRLSTICALLRARSLLCVVLCAALGVALCAPSSHAQTWPWSAKEEPVGSAQWWKKNKKHAVFEPGKGFKIEGHDGYFDGDGRPIQGPVAAERVAAANEVQKEVGLIPGLDPGTQYDKLKAAVGLGPNEEFARKLYLEGERLFREGEYDAAAEHFSAAAERGKHSMIQQHAMFMLAESYFFADRYIKARDAYDALVKEHSNTSYLDTVVTREWEIAQYWERYERAHPDWAMTPNGWDKSRPWFDTIGHSIKTYENIRLNDPTGPRADDAIMATANIYFERGRYNDADYHYTLLRSQYPRSELQFEAHLLGLQAKLRKYQGEDYDGTPLEESKALVKQLRMQFDGRLSREEKDRLATVEGQLNQEIATRDYRMATYWDSKKDYGAARYCYGQVIQKYPDTELAAKARERTAEIAEAPDRPPKRLAFLVDMFPESRERSRVARIPELQNGGTRLAQQPQPATPAPQQAPTTTR